MEIKILNEINEDVTISKVMLDDKVVDTVETYSNGIDVKDYMQEAGIKPIKKLYNLLAQSVDLPKLNKIENTSNVEVINRINHFNEDGSVENTDEVIKSVIIHSKIKSDIKIIFDDMLGDLFIKINKFLPNLPNKIKEGYILIDIKNKDDKKLIITLSTSFKQYLQNTEDIEKFIQIICK